MTQTEQPAQHQSGPWYRLRGPFALLSQRNFRLLVTGQFTALVGDQLFLVALPFVLLAGAADARDLGLVLLCLGLARAAAVPAGGVIGDRFPKRLVMLNSDLARCVFAAAMALVVLSPGRPLWAMAAIAGGIGFAQGMFLPSSYSIVPQLVPREQIVAANSVVTMQINLSVLVGPAIGGLLVAGVSPGPVFFIHSATFALSAVCLALIRITPPADPPPEPDLPPEPAPPEPAAPPAAESAAEPETTSEPAGAVSYRAFLRYAARSPLLPYSITVTFVVNLGYVGTVQIAMPAMAQERFADPALAFGFLLAAIGSGALVGAILSHTVLTRRASAIAAMTSGIIGGSMAMLVPFGPGFLGSWVELFAMGLTAAVTNVFFISALQRKIPSQYLGRAMSLVMLAAFGTAPVSYGLISVLVSTVGPTSAFLFTGITTVLAYSVGFSSREVRQLTLK